MQPRHATLSGHESIAKILHMEFMPGPLPLPLGQKEEDERVNREGIHLRGKWRRHWSPPGAGNELVCAQLIGDLNGKWVPNAGHPWGPTR